MVNLRKSFVAVLVSLLAVTSLQVSSSAQPRVGQPCTKKGQIQSFKSIKYVCALSGRKLQWKVSSNNPLMPKVGDSSASSTPVTAPSPTPSQSTSLPLPGINLSLRSISSSNPLRVQIGEVVKDSLRLTTDVRVETLSGRLLDNKGNIRAVGITVLESYADKESNWTITYNIGKSLEVGIYRKLVDIKTVDGRVVNFYDSQLEVTPETKPGLLLRTLSTCLEAENNCPRIADASNLQRVDSCKIYDEWEIQSFSQGFPRPKLSKVGDREINVLWMPVSFTDLPYGSDFVRNSEQSFAEMRAFFLAQSYGKSRITFTIPDPSSWLSQNKSWNAFQDENSRDLTRMMQSLLDQVKTPDLSKFDAIFLITSESSVIQSGGMTKASYQTSRFGQVNGVYLVVGGSYKGISHSLGHNLFSLEDLYIHPFYEKPNVNKWPMQFEIMGGGGIYSGWQRWLNGWLDDKDVRCNLSTSSETTHALSSLSNKSGARLLVIPMGPRKVWIAEVRNEDGDEGNGLFIYSLDTNIPHGAGPMTSINRTFGLGESWSNDELKITVLAQSEERLFITVKKN